jgi:metallo-beta-lactamase class B
VIWRRSRIKAAAVLRAAAFLCVTLLSGAPAYAIEPGNEPTAPFPIGDGLYYVGAADIAAYLISTDEGLILIDGGYESTAPQILANLKTLGFDPRQVKILLNTHAHPDHAGGLAALKKATGATLYASAEDGALLARGGMGDFLLGDTMPFPAVKPDRILADGETITLGAVTLTAHLTPGHTRGCTTWSFPVKVDGAVRQALVLCGLTLLPGTKLKDNLAYPAIASDYEKSYATWARLPCEVFLAPNSKVFHGAEKRAAMKPGAPNPFVDPEGCKAYLIESKARFDAELKR